MAPPVSPAAPQNCSTCGAPLPPGTDRCGRCGSLHGEWRRCPGCNAKAEVIRKGGLLYVCAACGRPRIPFEQPVARSGGEREALAKADADLRSSTMASGLGIVAFVIAAFALGAVTLSFAVLEATGLGIAALVAMVMFLVAGVFGVVTSKGAKKRAEEQMRDALGAAAVDVMRQRGAISAAQLAQILGVPEDVADQALTRLPARNDVRVDTVLDDRAADGQVRYRIADQTMPAEVLDEAGDFDARLREAMRAKEPPR